jgi:hypothetical protein
LDQVGWKNSSPFTQKGYIANFLVRASTLWKDWANGGPADDFDHSDNADIDYLEKVNEIVAAEEESVPVKTSHITKGENVTRPIAHCWGLKTGRDAVQKGGWKHMGSTRIVKYGQLGALMLALELTKGSPACARNNPKQGVGPASLVDRTHPVIVQMDTMARGNFEYAHQRIVHYLENVSY